MRNSKGFSIVEVLVAAAIVAIGAVIFSQLYLENTRQARVVLDQSNTVKALVSIQREIFSDSRYLPAQDYPANDAARDALLADPEVSGERCYDVDAAWVEDCDPVRTFYTAHFAKFREADRNFLTPPADQRLSHLPLATFYIKIDYNLRNSLGNQKKSVSFRKLVTDVLNY